MSGGSSGGNFGSTGRLPSYSNVKEITEWLSPYVDHPMCFGYPANRRLASTDKALLLSEKYQSVLKQGAGSHT